MSKRVLHVVGARPNFMKIAPVMAALRAVPALGQTLVHTGQHYDEKMAHVFFEELGLPRPDFDLGVGSGTHAEQTGAVMVGLERVLAEVEPDLVVVVGDVNSTLAAAIVSAKAGVPVAHVEAGLRSRDLTMPEEINRLVTDRLSEVLLTPSRDGDRNLLDEGVAPERIHFVGNVMIDTLLAHRTHAPWSDVASRYDVAARKYAVLTLHRPANVDDPDRFATILDRLSAIGREMPVIFPAHPRTAKRLLEHGLIDRARYLRMVEPLGYLEFLALVDHAGCVLTDSGGIQEETTVLGVPCFTLRDNTERPVTIEQGTNTLVGADARGLGAAFAAVMNGGGKHGRVPELWDGHAGLRVAGVLARFLGLDSVGLDRPVAGAAGVPQ
ncbi:MAG: UDP-N-acetylglucosamine 2-epimerase (non-hydrolyzing) [Vicinamibacteraceae bacterium]|nr:UDP-N-acetylglucosamine 2-epimerase (non-hydrolyzing) [Vicinamibacteraceae bacterium]